MKRKTFSVTDPLSVIPHTLLLITAVDVEATRTSVAAAAAFVT